MLGVVTRAVRVTVRGRVQGVFYRAHAAREAARLGVNGWVRNDLDGTVGLHLEGPDDAVDAMVAWCRRGSPRSAVTAVETEDVSPTGATSFEVD